MSSRLRAAAVAIVITAAGIAGWAAFADEGPELVVGDSVAADLAALAESTFDRFVVAAPAVGGCMGSLRLEAADELDDLARYDQSSHVVYVRVPATAASLEASLVHEFAHHLEVACDSHHSLRSLFLRAQGYPSTTPWFGDLDWEQRPSEQFAEAVVQVVLGRRSRNKVQLRLTPEAVRVVEAWLAPSA